MLELNSLSVKYSMHDVVPDVSYCGTCRMVLLTFWSTQSRADWKTSLVSNNDCVFVYQMAPPRVRHQTSDCSLLLIYWLQKDERLSWPGWLTCGRRFTHIRKLLSTSYRSLSSQICDDVPLTTTHFTTEESNTLHTHETTRRTEPNFCPFDSCFPRPLTLFTRNSANFSSSTIRASRAVSKSSASLTSDRTATRRKNIRNLAEQKQTQTIL